VDGKNSDLFPKPRIKEELASQTLFPHDHIDEVLGTIRGRKLN